MRAPDGKKDKKREVEQTNWAPEHSQALREYHAKGMSYSQIAKAINAKFATSYPRNAALGRAKRMGLAELTRSKRRSRCSSACSANGLLKPDPPEPNWLTQDRLA